MALALALVVAAVVLQGLMGAGRGGERLALLLRERQFARRTLALLRSELGVAEGWQTGAKAGEGAECSLSGRTPVLSLDTSGRRITYSVGAAPSQIWRGLVLMRCGPAYSLRGELSAGAAQNRVLLDGLASEGLSVEAEAPGVVRLLLRQAFRQRDGTNLPLTQRLSAATASS
ncbi:MAG: prepilin-type cleavage/methylation domain-containing protein [Cyanobacteriota bacterium]